MGNRKINKKLFFVFVNLISLSFIFFLLNSPTSFAKRYDASDLALVSDIIKAKGNNEKALGVLIKGTEDGIAIVQVYLAKTYFFGWRQNDHQYAKFDFVKICTSGFG
jgi:hypothetical protein